MSIILIAGAGIAQLELYVDYSYCWCRDSAVVKALASSTAVKHRKRFSFYLVGFYLMLSGNMGKDV